MSLFIWFYHVLLMKLSRAFFPFCMSFHCFSFMCYWWNYVASSLQMQCNKSDHGDGPYLATQWVGHFPWPHGSSEQCTGNFEITALGHHPHIQKEWWAAACCTKDILATRCIFIGPQIWCSFFSGNLGLYEVDLFFLGRIESWVLEVDISSFSDEAIALVQQC